MDLYNHRMIDLMQSGGNAASFQSLPWEKDQSLPWVNEDGTVNEKLKKTYDQHKHLIYKKKDN